MKTIVLSAVNLKVGGTLTILRDCLRYLSALAEAGDYRVVALVYRKELAFFPNIDYIEMQWPKKAWVYRLWCEYVTMRKISKRLSPVYLWISLHDTTPNVLAERRVVYCHNSFPYYRWKMREWWFAPKIVLFALLSNHVVKMSIHQNKYVVVQQEWMKNAFVRAFKLREDVIIVAPPPLSPPTSLLDDAIVASESKPEDFTFIFASAPDSHKNYECICQAAQILKDRMGLRNFSVSITIKGDENKYTRWLFRKWAEKAPNVKFAGYMDRQTVYAYYRQSDCLIYPSKVETWGLPITEFAAFDKPMLLADLPYAHETACGCNKVAFFDPENANELAGLMGKLIQGDEDFLVNLEKKHIPEPVAWSWRELFDILLK
jgi:glycosyltransferase involved in cell wall biosynthesis